MYSGQILNLLKMRLRWKFLKTTIFLKGTENWKRGAYFLKDLLFY